MMRAVVIGAGTMGTGIAMAFASAGDQVVLIDASAEALARARTRFERKGLGAIVTTRDGDAALAEADVIVEAVFEDLEIKRAVFRNVLVHARADALLATNTSTLDLDTISEGIPGGPERIVGMHFWNPAHVNRALEVIRGGRTSPKLVTDAAALGERLGKVSVVVGNCDGFVANRMLFKMIREAELLLEEGTPLADVDRALVDFGFPIGPLAMMDLAGVDVAWRVRQEGLKRGGFPYRLSRIIDRLHAAGRYGQKSGAGFYRYEPGSHEPVPDGFVEALGAEERRALGTHETVVSQAEIVERYLWSGVNEGARILDEGIASRAADIDAIWLHGFGFPAGKIGPMHYADATGLAHVLAFVRRRAPSDPVSWQPAPLLERLVAEGRSLYDISHPIGVSA